ncbi:MAG: FISUMP domain-containing protein [Bacteroidota bacterium]|nr:FISUMP domain-containing protein [Bacteroidota bacterium]
MQINSLRCIIVLFLFLCIACDRSTDQAIPPVAHFAFEPVFGLTTDTFNLKASATNSGSANLNAYYRWDWNSDGVWDTEYEKNSISKHRFYAPGRYQTILQVINSNGLTDTISQDIQIDQGYSPPHAGFVAYPPSGNFLTEFIFDASVSFDDEDSLDQLVFRWDWDGNGTWDTHFKSEPIVTHVFRDMDFYDVALQVQDPGKLTAQTMKTVEVNNLNPDLIPNFTWTPEYGTTADTFLLDASTTFYRDEPFTTLLFSWKLPPEYEWTEWDTCSSITVRFGREADYSLEMQVRDTNNLIAKIKKEITIYHENLPPKPVLEVGCKRGNIRTQFYFDSWMTRDPESLPTSLQVRWDYNGDGNFDTEYSKERTVYHQYPEAGTYQVVLEVKDPEGLSDTTSQYVIVSPYTNETGLIRDHRDEQMYGTVKVGNQWWMSENLNFSPWDPNKDYVEKMCYRRSAYDPVRWCNYLGGLYNVYHATRNDIYGDVEGICPKGWHMPSRNDWEELISSIGGFDKAEKLLVGGEADFNALFAGYGRWATSLTGRGVKFEGLGEITYFWSYKRQLGWPLTVGSWNIALLKDKSRIYTGFSENELFYSVRCVKDEE